jgi:hypothetical protein
MSPRRSTVGNAVLAGIAGIAASRRAPAYAQGMGLLKIGHLGLGSHGGYTSWFSNPPAELKGRVKCRPYAVWDDAPGVAEKMKTVIGFEKVIADPVTLVKESDVVHIQYADYRRSLELARPALEAGKPVFINRPFASSIADAEEIVRLAKAYNAPLMCASSREFQPEVAEIRKLAAEKGPVRVYETYCPEQHFTWMFPHLINYAHAMFGGGIESAYFTGAFNMDLGKWLDDKLPFGCSLLVLTWKSRNGQPPLIGLNHIGTYAGARHVNVFAAAENRMFLIDEKNIYLPMYLALNDFYSERKPPRPYEAILEEHRALAAANVSRLTGREVRLDSLGGEDCVPYCESIRRWVVRSFMKTKS